MVAGSAELHTCGPSALPARGGGRGAGLLECGEVSQRCGVGAMGLAGGTRGPALPGDVSWTGCLVGWKLAPRGQSWRQGPLWKGMVVGVEKKRVSESTIGCGEGDGGTGRDF